MIYLVRHGQTEWNRVGIFQGQLDSSLTPQGQQQIHAIGRQLAHILPEKSDVHIECSHLGRARSSAEIIRTILGLEKTQVTASEILAEIHLGQWQGLNRTQIEARWPGQLAERARITWQFQIPGGENYDTLMQRARTWLAQERKAPITVVVTHQQFSKALRGAYSNLQPHEVLPLSHEQNCFFHLHGGDVTQYCLEDN